MADSQKERLAAEVEERWGDFQEGLSDQRKYPVEQFRAFWDAGKRYAELTKNDPLIHRKVIVAINGLTDFLSVERKRIPGNILPDAERLECLIFSGYDLTSRGMNRQDCRHANASAVDAGRHSFS
jgi:hypothetical protein